MDDQRTDRTGGRSVSYGISRKYLVLSILSGCLWAAIAYCFFRKSMTPSIWGGVVASPFIGLAVGRGGSQREYF